MARADDFDCQRCGACCVNPAANRREGFVHYVAVERGDAILAKPDLVRRYVTHDERDEPHLRLDPEGRCLALRGGVGRRVGCVIYHHRPSPCRRVQAGDELCRRYRAATFAR